MGWPPVAALAGILGLFALGWSLAVLLERRPATSPGGTAEVALPQSAASAPSARPEPAADPVWRTAAGPSTPVTPDVALRGRSEPSAAPHATPSVPLPAVGAAPPEPLTIQVNARPWADVRLDGEPLGPTPLSASDVLPGRHRLEGIFPDGRVRTMEIEVHADSTRFTLR